MLLYSEESYQILGACFEVYKVQGHGFLEAVYQECLEIEFELRGIPFAAEHKLPLIYKGQSLRTHYKADLVCYDKIIVEVKAVKQLIHEHRAQTINYLKATGIRLGFLVNFCARPKLEYERLIL